MRLRPQLMLPFFSIIIPLYNKEHYIGSTLDHVLAQTFQNFEVIVVNDGSADGSGRLVTSRTDDRIRYYAQENQGVASARNTAIALVRGTYIVLLDADDLWQPTYLERMRQLIQSYPRQQIFATAVLLETSRKPIPSVYSITNLKANEVRVVDYFESSYMNSLLTSSSTVVHHRVFKKIGTYNPLYKSREDTDLWIRIGLQYKVVFLNELLVTYRYQSQSLSNLKHNLGDQPSLETYLPYETTHPTLKKFLDINRFSMAILAKLDHDQNKLEAFTSAIDLHNLNQKQRFLLQQPPLMIKFLHGSKLLMQQLGLHLSAYR